MANEVKPLFPVTLYWLIFARRPSKGAVACEISEYASEDELSDLEYLDTRNYPNAWFVDAAADCFDGEFDFLMAVPSIIRWYALTGPKYKGSVDAVIVDT
ncbi:MAG TPA: hypothetical protein PLH94_13150 [Fimbriimonadaceae bacterium]|nr:hypothetical protein [Fimbriimonadaceae bacterium]